MHGKWLAHHALLWSWQLVQLANSQKRQVLGAQHQKRSPKCWQTLTYSSGNQCPWIKSKQKQNCRDSQRDSTSLGGPDVTPLTPTASWPQGKRGNCLVGHTSRVWFTLQHGDIESLQLYSAHWSCCAQAVMSPQLFTIYISAGAWALCAVFSWTIGLGTKTLLKYWYKRGEEVKLP